MGREVRRVPADWDHPTDSLGNYIPMYTRFPYNDAEIAEGLKDGWLDAGGANYGIDIMPTWSGSEATHYQLYETTSEGTPISPIFASLDDLCEWAAKHATTFDSWTATADAWRQMLQRGLVYHDERDARFM